jgi:hypothetical protein
MKAGIDRIMALAGLILVLLQTAFLDIAPFEYGIILFGVLVTATGLWGLGSRLRPDRRLYLQLRAEVDKFIGLVRRINAHVVAGQGEQANEVKEEMHASVELIAQAAGVVADD